MLFYIYKWMDMLIRVSLFLRSSKKNIRTFFFLPFNSPFADTSKLFQIKYPVWVHRCDCMNIKISLSYMSQSHSCMVNHWMCHFSITKTETSVQDIKLHESLIVCAILLVHVSVQRNYHIYSETINIKM